KGGNDIKRGCVGFDTPSFFESSAFSWDCRYPCYIAISIGIPKAPSSSLLPSAEADGLKGLEAKPLPLWHGGQVQGKPVPALDAGSQGSRFGLDLLVTFGSSQK
ncbi:hypothetical protein, partial [uncultured Parabacteroides sp.]|uniref:hypothetical protein n=1 Tax=uncultured Parabacteroides sp. TaxID=512312 RepID=UPI0026334A2D